MPRRAALLTAIALLLAGCGGNQRYGTGNPIYGYTDCDILQAEGSTICDDVNAQSANVDLQRSKAAH